MREIETFGHGLGGPSISMTPSQTGSILCHTSKIKHFQLLRLLDTINQNKIIGIFSCFEITIYIPLLIICGTVNMIETQ